MPVIFGFIHSCQNKVDLTPETADFAVLHQKQSYQLDTQNGLEAYIKAEIGKNEIKITESSFEEAEDELGKFYLIRAKYKNEDADLTTSLAISLSQLETSDNKQPGTVLLTASCTMKCIPETNCATCKQTIIRQCQSQSCGCTSGIGGCTSEITFGGNEE